MNVQGKGSRVAFTSTASFAVLLLVTASSVFIRVAQAGNKGVPAFGRELIANNQRVTGEPSISIDGQDRIYVSTPNGFLTTASFVWRSVDHGMSFHLVPGNAPPVGKPLVTCVGGGDSGLAVDSVNRVYFVDLQGLTDVSNSVSSDQGATWSTTCNAANATGYGAPFRQGAPKRLARVADALLLVRATAGGAEPNHTP